MADYVNLQQTELDEVCKKLEEVHKSTLDAVSSVQTEVLLLSCFEGGMYTKLYSQKLQDMMSIIFGNILEMWKTVLADEETFSSAFVEKIKGIDTDGGGM